MILCVTNSSLHSVQAGDRGHGRQGEDRRGLAGDRHRSGRRRLLRQSGRRQHRIEPQRLLSTLDAHRRRTADGDSRRRADCHHQRPHHQHAGGRRCADATRSPVGRRGRHRGADRLPSFAGWAVDRRLASSGRPAICLRRAVVYPTNPGQFALGYELFFRRDLDHVASCSCR